MFLCKVNAVVGIGFLRRIGMAMLLLALFVVICATAIAVRSASSEIRTDFRGSSGRPHLPSAGPISTSAEVSFHSSGGNILGGWWSRGWLNAVVILLDGSGADRSQLVPEADILSEHGYSILMFDWPGQGVSSGQVRWGVPERDAFSAALNYAQHIAPGSILGTYAFSGGAMIATQVASRDTRIRGLALAGAFSDFEDLLRTQYGHWGIISGWSAIAGARLAGFRPEPRPVDVILHVDHTLFIAGTADTTVPVQDTLRLYVAAGIHKELWVVSGARHGTYISSVGRAEFARQLTNFFDQTLLGANASP